MLYGEKISTCYYKNEDTLTITEATGKPIISDCSVYKYMQGEVLS